MSKSSIIRFTFVAGILLSLKVVSSAMTIDVRVLSQARFSSVNVTVVQGYYHISAGSFHKTLSRFQDVVLKASGDQVVLYRNDKRLATSRSFIIHGKHDENIFRLNVPGQRERDYDDDLKVWAENGQLILVNQVDLENYVAGVVLSEVGKVDWPEYYKVQDIISRTYALKNLRRHKHEGYNLCDHVHCQVYKSRCNYPLIKESISITRGDVIVDSNGKLITAAFHSNSGGMTMNSEDVWSEAVPYLRAVNDTFGNVMSKALWHDTISTAKWLAYLGKKYQLRWEEESLQNAMRFDQSDRVTELLPGIPLKDIRTDWNLRSTYFSIIPHGDSLIFMGRGWGHGVGLSQQGAMRMIELGHDYEEVIRHYYRGVKIIRISELEEYPKP